MQKNAGRDQQPCGSYRIFILQMYCSFDMLVFRLLFRCRFQWSIGTKYANTVHIRYTFFYPEWFVCYIRWCSLSLSFTADMSVLLFFGSVVVIVVVVGTGRLPNKESILHTQTVSNNLWTLCFLLRTRAQCVTARQFIYWLTDIVTLLTWKGIDTTTKKRSKIEEKNEIAKNRIGCRFDYDSERREWKRIRPAV